MPSDLKLPLGVDVLTATLERLDWVFRKFPRIYLSFSAGKDSTVMLHLAAEMARKHKRKLAVLLIDLEAQYKATIEHALAMFAEYADVIEPYWVALPLSLRNAVSMYEPKWMCWEPGQEERWVRQPPDLAITDERFFPFFYRGMEFEEFIEKFGPWYGQGKATACLVGIRADESLNRFRALITERKTALEGKCWTTWKSRGVYNIYPLYDWRTRDIWIYHAKTGKAYNRVYDLMHLAGLSVHQMRICQPYGDDQRKGLYLYHALEPETWGRVVARVSGANSGALYSQESGNINGTIKIQKPEGHTWESFAKLLLESLPDATREHYENKIAQFLHWWMDRGYSLGIPDEADPAQENSKKVPSWRRICKMLLRNDYWAKGLSFTQTKSEAYDKYLKVMKHRRSQWNITLTR